MSSIDDIVLEPIERGFDAIGMMQGELAPVKRAAVGAGIGYAIAYGMKPGFAFMPDPSDPTKKIPRPFTGTAKKSEMQQSTYFPAWAIVAAPAVIFSVLI